MNEQQAQKWIPACLCALKRLTVWASRATIPITRPGSYLSLTVLIVAYFVWSFGKAWLFAEPGVYRLQGPIGLATLSLYGLLRMRGRSANHSDAVRLAYLMANVVIIIFGFAFCYREIGICTGGCTTRVTHYEDCLYFSAITFTTTGYGDLYPSVEARFAAACETLSGLVNFGLFISLLSGYLSPVKSEPVSSVDNIPSKPQRRRVHVPTGQLTVRRWNRPTRPNR